MGGHVKQILTALIVASVLAAAGCSSDEYGLVAARDNRRRARDGEFLRHGPGRRGSRRRIRSRSTLVGGFQITLGSDICRSALDHLDGVRHRFVGTAPPCTPLSGGYGTVPGERHFRSSGGKHQRGNLLRHRLRRG